MKTNHGDNTALALCVAMTALLICSAATPGAEVGGAGIQKQALELGSPFMDHAILQREMTVPVWGWAKPGSAVTVTFAGQKATAKADANGRWKLKLDPLKASDQGRELAVRSSDGESLVLKDLLVGEIWFASGQSNMEWTAGKSMCRDLANTLQRSKQELPVREYAAKLGSSLFLRSRVTSADGWKSSRQAGKFSALCLAFAWQLYDELEVPVGIMRSSHGATPIETWTPDEGFASHPKLQDIVTKIRQSDPTTSQSKEAYAKFYEDLKQWQIESEKIINRGGLALPRPHLPGIADEWKGAGRMYNFKVAPLVPYAIRGAIWCQGTSNGNDGRIYAAKMEALVNGLRENWGRPDLPFYFTQQQCYGEPNPDNPGFADLREVQTLFFMNAKNVGMVPQHDLNSARPAGIHYFNKLDPGKRLARWALAHEYGKDIPYTGPIYKSHTIKGSTVRVQFEQRGPGGGLMVASKGMAADYRKTPAAYFEPARATPGEKLKHFRLAGKDRVWHAAEAVIDGDEVVVTSKDVPNPVGVQYAYSATPMGANLYNKAGLPAIAFAYFDGKQLFKEDDLTAVAAEKTAAEKKWGKKSYLLPSSLFRNHAVIQRGLAVPVWGHGVPGTEITVVFGNQSKKTVVGEFEKWLVKLDPMPASSKGRDLKIICSDGVSKTIKDILVGDVWILTGTRNLSSEIIKAPKGGTVSLQGLPLVREFRIKTKTRRFRTPRKRRMEIGGGKYVASWQTADFDQVGDAPSVAAYYFAAKIQAPGVPVGIITLGAGNPPITLISSEGLQTATGFEKERDEHNLAYPNTDVCKKAIVKYIETLKKYNHDVAALLKAGQDLPDEWSSRAPSFPQPYYNQWASRTETPTHTYNFCISPLTPFAVCGVVWVPGKENIDEDVSRYPASLKAYAKSLAETYGQDKVSFVFAQPSAELVKGMTKPDIANSMSVEFNEWPKSLQEIATKLGALDAGGAKE